MNSTFSDWKDGEVFGWDEEVCGEDRSAADRGQWVADISGGQIWINDVSNVLLILDSSVILVCLYKLKWMKFHEILSACHILSPSGSFRELPSHMLPHGQNGEGMGTLDTEILWISPWDSQVQELYPVGAALTGDTNPFMLSPCGSLMQGRREGELAQEQQRKRSKGGGRSLFLKRWPEGDAELPASEAKMHEQVTRIGFELQTKKEPSLVSFWTLQGELHCYLTLWCFLAFLCVLTVLKSKTTSNQKCRLFATGKCLSDTLWNSNLAYMKMNWEIKQGSFQLSWSVGSNYLWPMDCSTPGFPVHHQLWELTQIHVHWVSDAIQPSLPLSSPSASALNLS